jgi:AraC-like DNA-binding protein
MIDPIRVATFFTHADKLVPMQHPSVLVDEAIAQGADRESLLAGTGISESMLGSADARISYLQFGMLTRNALNLTQNPALGLDFGQRIHLSHLGVLGLLLMSSESVGAAIEGGLKYYRSLAPAWDLELRVEGSEAVLTAREVISFAPFRPFATESLLTAFGALNRQLFGIDVVYDVQVHYSAPPHADCYRSFFDGTVHFDAEYTRITFDGSLLQRPLAGADGATARWAERECAALLSNLSCQNGIVEQARTLLRQVPGRYLTQEALARTLQTSTRSMRRSLKGLGTSYTQLLEEALREHAVEYLVTKRMNTEDVAAELGFSDARSFRRAFKRWTGKTPNEYRESRAMDVQEVECRN